MRKIAEKIAVVAQICITMVFAITTTLNLTRVYPQEETIEYNGALASLMFVLFVIYLALSAYILYVNFSEKENLKRVLLFCDSESATTANTKVVRNIINECARQAQGLTVKKIKIRADDKKGFALTLKINVNADNVAQTIDTFRCLLADGFKNTLGISFNSINFEVRKLNTRYEPSLPEAENKAQQLGEQREITDEIYEEPLNNDVDLQCLADKQEQESDEQQNVD